MKRILGGLAVLAFALAACATDTPVDGAADPSATTAAAVSDVYVVYGDDVPAGVRQRITALVGDALGRAPAVVAASDLPASFDGRALVLALGSSPVSRAVISQSETAELAPEGFVVRSAKRGAATVIAAGGAPAKERPHGNLGTLHAAYAALEELGFAFLHPLAPTVPRPLLAPTAAIERAETPRWDVRAIHVHTQHPLELTELLQGWGERGPDDAAGFEAMIAEWDRFLEWAVANGENGVEWALLWAESWKAFADSDLRIARLARLVDRAHDFGLAATVDVPIAFGQQHAFRLVRDQGDLESERTQIRMRIDWLMRAGFDGLGTEAGTSEFTHPAPDRMLAWMNEVARYLDEHHGKRAFIKVHCSTGQTAEGYPDPETGGPINFNMLPHHADPRLGVLPHTVEHYGLTDPAPTYGNTTFEYMRRFLQREVGTRPVVYYPETAYWVSFDVDVPLFLPLYADRRLFDLRLLAHDEEQGNMGPRGAKMGGQLVFSSGWEWGYWLNDVVAARAAWQPELAASSQEQALKNALGRITRVFGTAAPDVALWIADVVSAEQALLIEGRVAGEAPSTVVMRNGQAYLQGWETWDDVSKLASKLPVRAAQMTQPDKLGLVDMRAPGHAGPSYASEVAPLLAAMESTFADLAARGNDLRAKIPAAARDLFDDLADAMTMTALRARQVHGLYDYVAGFWTGLPGERRARLEAARSALGAAARIAKSRESRYRVPAERIAGWRPNPTAYPFGYLWSVRSLYYWWRDEGKAVDAPLSPCYLNVINPVDVAFGEGIGTDAVRLLGGALSSDEQRGCLAEPSRAPTLPPDGLRSRP